MLQGWFTVFSLTVVMKVNGTSHAAERACVHTLGEAWVSGTPGALSTASDSLKGNRPSKRQTSGEDVKLHLHFTQLLCLLKLLASNFPDCITPRRQFQHTYFLFFLLKMSLKGHLRCGCCGKAG